MSPEKARRSRWRAELSAPPPHAPTVEGAISPAFAAESGSLAERRLNGLELQLESGIAGVAV